MATCLGKSGSFGLPRVPFGFEGRMWDLIVSVPDHCLSFYFSQITQPPAAVFKKKMTSKVATFRTSFLT